MNEETRERENVQTGLEHGLLLLNLTTNKPPLLVGRTGSISEYIIICFSVINQEEVMIMDNLTRMV